MICLNCGKETRTLICRFCRFDNNKKLIVLIKDSKECIGRKDYSGAEKILQQCINLTKGTDKEQVFKNQINKLHEIIGHVYPGKSEGILEKPDSLKTISSNYFHIEEDTKRKPINRSETGSIYLKIAILIMVAVVIIYQFYPGTITALKKYLKLHGEVKTDISSDKIIKRNIPVELKEEQKVIILPYQGRILVMDRIIDKLTSFLPKNKTVITKRNSEAVLKLENSYAVLSSEVRLRVNKFYKKNGRTTLKLNLNKGKIYFRTKIEEEGDRFTVVTPSAVVRTGNAKFVIESEGEETSIYCGEGEIEAYSKKTNRSIILQEEFAINISLLNNLLKPELISDTASETIKTYDSRVAGLIEKGAFEELDVESR